jgi:hypothetical protein
MFDERDETAVEFFMGFAFEGAIGLLFVALRLLKVVDWPWWLVVSPFSAPFVFLFVVALLCWTVDDEERDKL